MTKELIDKHKILEMAIENANDGKYFFENSNVIMHGLSFEEELMLLGFTYVRLLSKTVSLPNQLVKEFLMSINTKVQSLAKENQQYKEFSKRQIELIKPTENARVQLIHQLNDRDFENALETACKLIDIYCFGVAGSNLYQDTLQRAEGSIKPSKKAV